MMLPEGFRGAAFTAAEDGDMKGPARRRVATHLDISEDWATVTQVHGDRVIMAARPGDGGSADAVGTTKAGLPVAVFTADCAGVILESPSAVMAVHAGWRGVAAGTVAQAGAALEAHGGVVRAAIGPLIGPCCFEVGPEVSARFGEHVATTTWGSASVDLAAAIRDQVRSVTWWTSGSCTRCEDGWFSHRGDATADRLAAIGWMP